MADPPSTTNRPTTPRQIAARLILDLLDDVLNAREVINRWPVPHATDPSLDTAFQAICHFEADETQQQRVSYYVDVQLDMLNQMQACLARDDDLPAWMLHGYGPDHRTGYYGESHVFWAPIQRAVTFFLRTVTQAFGLVQTPRKHTKPLTKKPPDAHK